MGSPMKIRAAAKDGVTTVRVLMAHEMESGQRKDAEGKTIPAWHITTVQARIQDRVVLQAQFGTAISKNPYLQFSFKGGEKGDPLTVSWKDDRGDTREDTTKIS